MLQSRFFTHLLKKRVNDCDASGDDTGVSELVKFEPEPKRKDGSDILPLPFFKDIGEYKSDSEVDYHNGLAPLVVKIASYLCKFFIEESRSCTESNLETLILNLKAK